MKWGIADVLHAVRRLARVRVGERVMDAPVRWRTSVPSETSVRGAIVIVRNNQLSVCRLLQKARRTFGHLVSVWFLNVVAFLDGIDSSCRGNERGDLFITHGRAPRASLRHVVKTKSPRRGNLCPP